MIALDGLDLDTAPFAIREGFDFLTAVRESELVQRPIGASLIKGGKREPVTLEVPMWITGVAGGGKTAEDKVLEAFGKIGEKREKAEAMAGLGGMPGTVKLTGATNTSDITIMQIEVIAPKVDLTHITANKVAFSIKLTIDPFILGPEYKVAEGRKPQGVIAADITISNAKGDLPGPARVVVKNEGTVSQQFAMLGLQWRDGVSGNKLVLRPDTFDVSTAPLDGTYFAGTNEVQTATKSGTISGGSFTLTYEGQTTTSLAHNASTATVKAALEALSTIGAGNINVTGSALSSGNMVFTFQGALAGVDTSLIVLNSSLTGGGSAPITQTTAPVGGRIECFAPLHGWRPFFRTAAQTDTGSYDLLAAVQRFDIGGMPIRLRATISTGDPSSGVINRGASIPDVPGLILVNLGPVHAGKRQSAGPHKWTATISGTCLASPGSGALFDVLALIKVPTEHGSRSARVSRVIRSSVLYDDFGSASGAVTGDAATMGGNWASIGGSVDSDDITATGAPANSVIRTAVSDTATNLRFGRGIVLGSSVLTGQEASVDVAVSGGYTGTAPVVGLILRFTDSDNFCVIGGGHLPPPFSEWYLRIYTVVGGTVANQQQVVINNPTPRAIIGAEITANGLWSAKLDGVVVMSGYLAELNASGALQGGKSGIIDWWPNASAVTRTFRDFTVDAFASDDSIIHPSRRLQWQPDGSLEREASGGTDYAYAQGQQGAGVPMLGPAGSENINNRLLIASADFNPDMAASGNPAAPFSYEVYHRPAYLLGRHES